MKMSVFCRIFLHAIIISTITSCRQGQASQSFDTILSTIAPVFDGIGVPEAPIYDPQSPGPHKLLLLDQYGNLHQWNDELPPDWLPRNDSDVELVVVLGTEYKHQIGSQVYETGKIVTRSRFYMDVRVRSAYTGDILIDDNVGGSIPQDFPLLVQTTAKDFAGQHVTVANLIDGLYPIVWGRMISCPSEDITALSFSKNGKEIAAAFDNDSIYVWELKGNSIPQTFTGTESENPKLFPGLIFSYRDQGGNPEKFIVSHSRNLEAVLSSNKSILIGEGDWEGTTRKLYPQLEGDVRFIALHPNAEYLLIISRLKHYIPKSTPTDPDVLKNAVYYKIFFYHVKYNQVLREIEIPINDMSIITFSKDGDKMAFGNSEGQILVLPISDLLTVK